MTDAAHPSAPSPTATDSRTAPVTTRILSLPELEGDSYSQAYQAWRTMHEHSSASVISHPDYLLLEHRHEQPAYPARVVLAEREGQPVGCAVLFPKTIRTRPAGTLLKHFRLRGYRLAGNEWIADDDDTRVALLAAIEQFLTADRADALLIEDLDEASPLAQLVHSETGSHRAFSPTGFVDHWAIDLTGGADDYWTNNFSGKTRRTIRYKARKFGESEVVRVTDPSQVDDYLTHSHAVSKNSWQTHQFGLRVPNTDEELERLTFLATRGKLRSYLLMQNGEPVAFMYGVVTKGRFLYEEVAYDQDHGSRSPGQVLLFHVLNDLFEHDTPDLLDFGFGTATYKEQFANRHSRSGTIWLVPKSTRLRLVLGHLNASRKLSGGLKSGLDRLGVRNRVRNLMRRLRGNGS